MLGLVPAAISRIIAWYFPWSTQSGLKGNEKSFPTGSSTIPRVCGVAAITTGIVATGALVTSSVIAASVGVSCMTSVGAALVGSCCATGAVDPQATANDKDRTNAKPRNNFGTVN